MKGPWQSVLVSTDILVAKLNEVEGQGREVRFVVPVLNSHVLVVSREAKPEQVVQAPKKGRKS